MSYSQWINLFIIFGLISYSYGYNAQNNSLRRRTRRDNLKELTKGILRDTMDNQDVWDSEIRQKCKDDKEAMEEVCREIMEAANLMAGASFKDSACVAQWSRTQGSLRRGIQLIIESYRRYIGVHREVCQSIENFANRMITKYESELTAIDRMSAPIDNDDYNSDGWVRYGERFPHRMNYARLHQETLRTAIDCAGDLAERTLYHQRIIVSVPPVRTYPVVQLNPQYSVRSYSFPCKHIDEDNGCQACPIALSDESHGCADEGCGGCIGNIRY